MVNEYYEIGTTELEDFVENMRNDCFDWLWFYNGCVWSKCGF